MGEAWRDHQNAYFGAHGLGITVDPIAAVPGEHLGPVRFRHPQSEKVKAAEARREVNAKAARDPATVVDTLRRQQQRFDGRTLDRFLAKHLTDPDERAAVKERVLEQEKREKREALEKAAWADRVPSGWRPALVEDIAHELS